MLKFFAHLTVIITVLLIVLSRSLYPLRYENEINDACNHYGVQKELVLSVIKCESGFRESAKSHKGAIGLMQLMPTTASWCAKRLGIEYSDEMLYNPSYNINLGVYYLSYLCKKFPLNYAICAYNAGEGTVSKWIDNDGKIKFSETRAYYNRVIRSKKIYEILLR